MKEMELTLIGLQNGGKSSLAKFLTAYPYSEDMIPTIGFNMHKGKIQNATLKVWDLGGQPRFRSLWERYCRRPVSAIVYVVDAADHDNVSISRSELHDLVSKESLVGIPLLVLGNKIDKPQALSKEALRDEMDLRAITDREVGCYMISLKMSMNMHQVIDWLLKHGMKEKEAEQGLVQSMRLFTNWRKELSDDDMNDIGKALARMEEAYMNKT